MANIFKDWTPKMVVAFNNRRARPDAAPDPNPSDEIIAAQKLVITSVTVRKPKLNKLESAWYAVLKTRHQLVLPQAVTLILGFDTRYTPDFFCADDGQQPVAYETKAFMREDARVKLYTAATIHSWLRFVLVTKPKGESWQETEVA